MSRQHLHARLLLYCHLTFPAFRTELRQLDTASCSVGGVNVSSLTIINDKTLYRSLSHLWNTKINTSRRIAIGKIPNATWPAWKTRPESAPNHTVSIARERRERVDARTSGLMPNGAIRTKAFLGAQLRHLAQIVRRARCRPHPHRQDENAAAG